MSVLYLNAHTQGLEVISEEKNKPAIRGENTNPTGGSGVYGITHRSTGIGVRGEGLNSGVGVYGITNNYFGVLGVATDGLGVQGQSQNGTGVSGYSTNSFGIRGGSSENHGAYFSGNKDGGFADIILGASSDTNTGDNGVIRSDPEESGSDIFMVANDAVVAKIDNNNDDSGNFLVYDGNNTNLFQVTIDGDVKVKGSTVHNSDRNKKEQIIDISYDEVLQAITDMPIYEWQYKGQDRKHIGPMAQDFYIAFGLGIDNKTIASIDIDGVALAAIKAQQTMIKSLEDKIEQHETEFNSLRKSIKELKMMIHPDLIKQEK